MNKYPGEKDTSKEDDCENCDCDCDAMGCGPSYRPSTTDILVGLAQRAKMELIHDKVKKALEAKRGKIYDKIAEALADHLSKQAERSQDERASYDDLKSRIDAILEGKK